MPRLERLERLELCENQLGGDTIGETIARLYPNLVTIKLSSNKIQDVADIAGLKALAKLESLDLSDNPICTNLGEDYQKKVREVLSDKFEILDCLNKAGQEVVSDEDESDLEGEDDQSDEDDDNEEGEDEINEDDDNDDQDEGNPAGEAGEEETEEDTTDRAALKKAKMDTIVPHVPATSNVA